MQISDLQIDKTNWHAGLTEANHLRNFFLVEPEMASQVVTRVYNKQNGYKNALSFLTGGLEVLFYRKGSYRRMRLGGIWDGAYLLPSLSSVGLILQ